MSSSSTRRHAELQMNESKLVHLAGRWERNGGELDLDGGCAYFDIAGDDEGDEEPHGGHAVLET